MIKNVGLISLGFILALTYGVYATVSDKEKGAPHVQADTAKPLAAPNDAAYNEAYLSAKIAMMLNLEVESVSPSPVPNFAEVVTNRGLFYISYDGEFFMQGKIYSMADRVIDVTEQAMTKMRLSGVEKFKDDMIEYKAENEQYVVTVFTDITCGFCRQMHTMMNQYNDLGITVRYLAYPREGIRDRSGNYTQGYENLRSIWCNEDPAKALTSAKAQRGHVAQRRICETPIEAEFNFGRQVGVTGTPAIILEDGTMLSGKRDPEDLKRILDYYAQG
ncbi:thioredoxin fold domain-containing protein [Thalassotalea agarivorans]|uniref:Thiol:disulfide interchange protein n=1 Tax=Thalassotalea agarivorans TaxID=349064 RepID=A0A1H9Y0N0_THASX|nr:thioredoxin fold domain-containing protein [Thalassotalea agarivorans]SES62216.1 thiol:disulfide interchange protein DsbC [Thalassotalea agarivorans]